MMDADKATAPLTARGPHVSAGARSQPPPNEANPGKASQLWPRRGAILTSAVSGTRLGLPPPHPSRGFRSP